jgi:hypothetical protein
VPTEEINYLRSISNLAKKYKFKATKWASSNRKIMNQENFQAQQNEVVSNHDQRELEIDLKPFFSFAESI